MHCNNSYFNKKSISPLIATVLIVLVSVVLIAGIVSFSKDFTTGNLDESSVIKYDKSNLDGLITFLDVYENTDGNNSKIVLKNLNTYSDLNIIGYKLRSLDSTYSAFLNTYFELSESVLLEKNKLNQIEVICIPDEKFDLDLYADDNSIVTVPIHLNSYLNSCDNLDYFITIWQTDLTTALSSASEKNEYLYFSDAKQESIIYFASVRNPTSTNQIALPLVDTGAYDFIVDWGDGSSSHITSYTDANRIHTYSAIGEYTVKISGDINGWGFTYTPTYDDKYKLKQIVNWGPLILGNTSRSFENCANLTITATDYPELYYLTYLFSGCSSIINIPNLDQWDISNFTDISSMFRDASSFNQDLSDLNVSTITSFDGIFTNTNMSAENCQAIATAWGQSCATLGCTC